MGNTKTSRPQVRRTARLPERIGLTTGQAARYCLVSPDTIVNWIASGHLRAQRTAGGQYRIRAEDLREFMVEHGMRTDELVKDFGLRPMCWEFWTLLDGMARSVNQTVSCHDCPVFRARASVCHEIRPLLPGGTLRAPSCADCVFFATVGEVNGHKE